MNLGLSVGNNIDGKYLRKTNAEGGVDSCEM
jgi:hypothetical protein